MSRFSIPSWVQQHNRQELENPEQVPDQVFDDIARKLARFRSQQPLVTIAIPAFNEERHILKTLSSFAAMDCDYPTELYVVNNNSSDQTCTILARCGVRIETEINQGISFARQKALDVAKGQIFLNADADSIYPRQWLNTHVRILLEQPEVTCVYGRYSFIPEEKNGKRWNLALYEMIAETYFSLRRARKEFLNVMGFNFSFRTEDAKKVGGFNTKRPKWSDGWMAMQLQALGRLHLSNGPSTRVWTSDRRIRVHGSLTQAFLFRVKKSLAN